MNFFLYLNWILLNNRDDLFLENSFDLFSDLSDSINNKNLLLEDSLYFLNNGDYLLTGLFDKSVPVNRNFVNLFYWR